MKSKPRRVARVDRCRMKMDSMPVDSRGFARVWGTLITADSVLEYGPMDGHPDGHLEFVPESTVFDEDALASLIHSPITFLHPAEPVSADNSVRTSVGHIIEYARKGKRLRARFQVEDSQTLSRIRGGVIEISPGYTTELLDADGLVVDGRKINAIQTNRVYNHVAIVPEARAGHDNALVIDARILPADGLRIQIAGEIMKRITIDGKTIEVDADILAQIQKLTGGLGNNDQEEEEEEEEEESDKKGDGEHEEEEEDSKDDAEDEPSDASKSKDAPAKGDPPSAINDAAPKLDAAALTALTAQITKDVMSAVEEKSDKRDAARTRTASVISSARAVLPESYNFDGKSAGKIMRAAIKEKDPDLAARAKNLKGDALYGFFQGVIATPSARTDSRTAVTTVTQPQDSYAAAIEERRQRVDAVANCGQTGDSAVRCDAALKLIKGGKE